MQNQYRSKINLSRTQFQSLVFNEIQQSKIQERFSSRELGKIQIQIQKKNINNYQVERKLQIKKLSKVTQQELEEFDNIELENKNYQKIKDYQVVHKRREIDTLVAIALIVLFFCLTIHLAPNQYYNIQK